MIPGLCGATAGLCGWFAAMMTFALARIPYPKDKHRNIPLAMLAALTLAGFFARVRW